MPLTRAQFLTAGLAAGLAGIAQASENDEHAVHSGPKDPKLSAIASAAADCAQKSDACLTHCLRMLGTGDTDLKDCSLTTRDTATVCAAMARVAGAGTAAPETIKSFAQACARFCRDCEAQCRKHADKHEVCKACMDSCTTCAKACEAYAA